jgi:uncharacterized membrane protein (DUF485 family)
MIENITENKIFKQITFERSCLGYGLATAMALAYFAFILTIAFQPSALAAKMSGGSVISVGIVVGVGLMAFAFLLTAIYVAVANMRLDPLGGKLREKMR